MSIATNLSLRCANAELPFLVEPIVDRKKALVYISCHFGD
jgi:hypothetical protein